MIDHFFIIWVLVLGIYGLTKDGSLFGFAFTWMYDDEEELRTSLYEPVTECLCCMSSFWTCMYFGALQGLGLNLVIFIFYFNVLALFDSIDFMPEDVAKWLYLTSVGVFIYFIPENNIDALFCIVGIFGVNYQIESLYSTIQNSNIE